MDDTTQYNSSSIINRITSIQELSLIEYHYTSVIGLKSNKSIQEIPIPFTGKSFLATYDGVIKAGIDLEKSKVTITEDAISVIIPKARITNHIVDESTLIVYDESKNILNPIKIEDYNEALKLEKKNMEDKALKNGILSQAEEQAVTLINSILSDIEYEQIAVTVSKN